MIELKQAEKLYGKTRAQREKEGKGFRRISLTIPDGQVVGLFGENGAGKTTLLRAMAGLTSLTGGSIEFDGAPVQEQYAQFAYISGEGISPYDMTPLEYQQFLQAFYPHFNEKRYHAMLKFFSLDPNQRIGKMSLGQRSKVEISVGMGKCAKYILLDEPFLGKDVFSRRDFLKLLAGSLRGDETILITSHFVEELEPLLDRVLILHEGKLVADTMLDDLRESGDTLMDLFARSVDYDSTRYQDIFQDEFD